MFYKGHLYKILRSKIYVGKIEHKNEEYEGLHEAIIDRTTFDKVPKSLDENTVRANNAAGSKHYSLLASKIYDDKNNVMSPSHSRN